MNVHESEKIAGIMLGKGFSHATDIASANIIVYNTCCIRETAESKLFGHLGRVKKLKERNPKIKVVLCGCLSQKNGAADQLKKRFPYVDLIIGTHNINLLGEYLDKLETTKQLCEVWENEREIVDAPIARQGTITSFLNIMYGCNNFCSYCIVPYVRGRERSSNFNDIINDTKTLLAQGYKEITLLGQNVNSYLDGDKNFATLLDAIACIDGKFRLKFMTSHPKDLSEAVVKIIAQSPNISKYIHLPIQAGNDRILGLMNRKYTAEKYLSQIEMIRKFIPNAGISTDIMVGFPSETEQEFLDTLRLVEKVRFNNIFTFIYNRRSGTAADKMPNQIDRAVKTDRIERLIATQYEIERQLAQASIGNTYEILCEGMNGNMGYGKSENDMSVSFPCTANDIAGFTKVKITDSNKTKLIGVKSLEEK